MVITPAASHRRSLRARRPAVALLTIFVALASLAASCRTRNDGTLTGLCEGRGATQRVESVVDTILPYASPAVAALKGQRFTLRFTYAPAAPTGPTAGTAECQGAMGDAQFSGDLPDALRMATSGSGAAAWRIEGDTIMLDLNPKARDNNLVMSLPLRGGRGRWALSTFAGEVARGSATAGR